MAGPRGAQVFFTRQKTSKERLAIKWDYPEILKVVGDGDDKDDGSTTTRPRMRALSREEALANVANGDLRPLLVLRDCEQCKGSDDALLSDRVTNELTATYARWFHCVRLPTAVLRADHTFAKLFEGQVAPHMFVCSHDGENLVPLGGRPGQRELWQAMTQMLSLEYEGDAERTAKDILKLLSKYDHLDSMEQELNNQLALELEKRGDGSDKVRALHRKIERLRKERAEVEKVEAKLFDLRLKRQPSSASGK
ncbi:MAG: hypothetical protein R3F56_07105 [Planctomycetota bacterium]